MKSCVELLRSCGINILVVFSDIPVFCLDYKLPTTLKHRTRNTWGSFSGSTRKVGIISGSIWGSFQGWGSFRGLYRSPQVHKGQGRKIA